MAERQGHPWIAGLVGLVTLEAVAFGSLFLLLLRAEGWAVGLELTSVGTAIGVAVLLLFLIGGAWCTWRVASGRWGLREAGRMVVAPRRPVPVAPVRPEASRAKAAEEAPAGDEPPAPKPKPGEMPEAGEAPSEAPEPAATPEPEKAGEATAPKPEEAGEAAAPKPEEAGEAAAPKPEEAGEAAAPKPEEPASSPE